MSSEKQNLKNPLTSVNNVDLKPKSILELNKNFKPFVYNNQDYKKLRNF